MIRETTETQDKTSQILSDTSNIAKLIYVGLAPRGHEDSGIEITPRKNGDLLRKDEEDLEDLELLKKLKTVSRSQVLVQNSAITSLRTIH